MGHNNIIELNGKQYDAITGTLLGTSRIKATPAKRQVQAAPRYHGRVIDGFVTHTSATRRATMAAQTVHAGPTPKTSSGTGHPASKAKLLDIARTSPKLVAPHQAERSHTLMRHAVKKPTFTLKPAIKPTLPTEMMARPKSELTKQLEKKLSVTNVDPHKLAHAKYVAKSHYIRRFNKAQASHTPMPQTAPLAPSTASRANHATPQAAAIRLPQLPKTVAAATTPAPTVTARSQDDIFEAALAVANSHKQAAPSAKHIKAASFRRRRLISLLAGAGAFIVLAGFIGYLNLPAIQLHVASVRAGFSAAAPGYHPTGYARSSIESAEGKVVMQYRSGDSNYKITQIASDWNSQTLLDYYTETFGAPQQTVQSQGRTIYLYDNTRAAWVNGGIRYEISGNAALNSKDLVSLATSM